ncbi:SulP family inorganic anion transporter [Nocardioides caldifontis]|uniref:SulP family inorganic anion transporter n=1 Tax=Nocardioides caldifontis TaxID=2588938 RepID=UPI001EF138D1|nr:SulP family inorganic anion transporter [Nocardioides caldifontis]
MTAAPQGVRSTTSVGSRLRAVLPRREDYRAMTSAPGRDLVAGVTVGVVALPLALAFGISSGMGAAAGLVTAIVAGALAALFGGSNLQVSGPTGAMTVVLVPIVALHGAGGVLVVGLMAGALLVVAALAGLGKYVRLVPLPVIEGFTLGIAVIIALQQLPSALGVAGEGEAVVAVTADAVATWLADPRWTAPLVATAVAATVLVVGRLRPSVPGALVAVVGATVATAAAGLPLATIGALPSGLPAPSLPELDWEQLRVLAPPALAVAALAALESLLSATVADAMSVSERHDPDRELFGQGVANLVTPLFGGVPATAAIARTAVNVRTGARSRLASLTHAAVLLVVVLALAPVVAEVPLAALAGVLVATAARMVEGSSLRALWRSSRSDAAVLTITFCATVLLDLATAVVLGILLAGALALRQLARTAELQPVATEPADMGRHDAEEQALLHERIVAYRLEGPLFFLGAHDALLELTAASDIRVVVLRMSRVTTLDSTAAALLADTIRSLEGRGIDVLVSGLPGRFRRVLERTGLLSHLESRGHLFAGTPDAVAHARRHARHLAG